MVHHTEHEKCSKFNENYIYKEKLGFVGVHLLFLFLPQNIYCGYSVEPPQRDRYKVNPQNLCFEQKKNTKN